MIKTIWSWLRSHYGKLMPLFIIAAFITVAAVTDTFGLGVRETVRSTLLELATQLKPMMAKLLLAMFMLYIAWFTYTPFCNATQRILCQSGASQRGRDLVLKIVKFLFWAITLFLVFTFAAEEFFGKFVVGFGVFTAALTLSLQGAANDFICGLLIQFTRKVVEGDNVTLEGLQVAGIVKSVGYLSTIVDTTAAVVHVPNREVWGRAVKVLKPEPKKRLIIMPTGVEYPAEKTGDQA